MTEQEALDFPQVYVERKVVPMIVAIAVSCAVLYMAHTEPDAYPYILIVPIALALLIYWYPMAIVTLYPDKIEYRWGSKKWTSPWIEVSKFYAVNSAAHPQHPEFARRVFIETKSGTTKILETRYLKLRDQKIQRRASHYFATEVSRLSGCQLVPGDPSIRKYGSKITWIFIVVVAGVFLSLLYFATLF